MLKSGSLELQEAVQVIRAGGVVGYPSETVWGLGVLPRFPEVLSARKGREEGKPLQLSCPDAETALSYCVPTAALIALLGVLPGPLTVVTPGRATCPPEVAPGGLVGVRVPEHALALALLRETGPLLTTSLNPAGERPASTFQEAQAYGLADVLLSSGLQQAGGLASTVVQLPPDMSDAARILRVGAFPVARLRDILAGCGMKLIVELKV